MKMGPRSADTAQHGLHKSQLTDTQSFTFLPDTDNDTSVLILLL